MTFRDRMIEKALNNIEIDISYFESDGSSPEFYSAEIEFLGIKSSGFTEEGAVALAQNEARYALNAQFSIALKILNPLRQFRQI